MSNDQPAHETKGVSVELLETIDLGPEIEGMAGRQFRMRMVTMQPRWWRRIRADADYRLRKRDGALRGRPHVRPQRLRRDPCDSDEGK